MSDIHIALARYPEDLEALRAVREPVFIVEQHVPPEMEWDALDPVSVHVLARDGSGAPIGAARLTPEHTIGRMAVLPAWRGQGVGAAMLNLLLDQARAQGYPALELHAQTHAIGFYEGFGFVPHGEEYDEAGIPHRSMRLTLDIPATGSGGLIEVDTPSDLARLMQDIIARGRRGLWLYTRDLDPAMLDTTAASEALRRFAIGQRGAQLRVLAQDLRRATREGHALISLAQRLPSHFEIRVVEQEPDVQYASGFLLNDAGGYLFRPIATRYEASADLDGGPRQRQLLAYFNDVWERARPASELRAL